MAEKLTPQQAQVVHNRGGRLLVSAAAGSGKTKVLVDRLLEYVTDPMDPANLDDFLIITYTKAAAAELRGKIAARLTQRIAENPDSRHLQRQLQRLYLTKISTVHSFCGDILREYAYRLDISADFRVADENECRALRETVMAQVLDDCYERATGAGNFEAFIDTQGMGRNDQQVPRLVQKVYDSARCHLDPEGWLQACLTQTALTDVRDVAQTPWGAYLLTSMKALFRNYRDSLNRCAERLSQCPGQEKPTALLLDTVYHLDQLCASQTWDQACSRIHMDFGTLRFSKKELDEDLSEKIKLIRKDCMDAQKKWAKYFVSPSEEILQDLQGNVPAVRGLLFLVQQFSKAYDRAKTGRRILDFGDLEHKMLDLLLGRHRTGPTAAARELGQRFREVLVDEYQDSNAVQDAIFGAITQQRQNLFMVGDVKQSIYQFRLADPGIFLEKYHRFLPAEDAAPGQDRKILLSHNFRSAGPVIDAVNDVFRTCMSDAVGGLTYGDEEALREGISHAAIGEPEVEFHMLPIAEKTYPEEAAFVARRITELLDGTHMIRQGDSLRPITADDIVILLRSPGSSGHYYQRALENVGIRCNSGGGTDLLQAAEIQALRALLQTIFNPRQDIPLLATMTSPLFCFIADDLARIRSCSRSGDLYDALLLDGDNKTLSFLETLSRLRQESPMISLSGLLELIYAQTHILEIYAAMDDGEGRCSNLLGFFKLAADFDSLPNRDLSQFLEHLQALEIKGLQSEGDQSAGAVTVMSIHKSKGLEFPVVILAGLSKAFNRDALREQVLCHKELGLGMNCVDVQNRVRYPSMSKRAIMAMQSAESTGEELRVLYVAMTRARDRLIMTYASKNPEKEIREMTARMELCSKALLTCDVSCSGQWVLLEALQRMEAGALHVLGGRPNTLHPAQHPWYITAGAETAAAASVRQEYHKELSVDEHILTRMREAAGFTYPHLAATETPSKQTATEKKGRQKDMEAAEEAAPPRAVHRNWRKPSFLDAGAGGRDYGNGVHKLMQYIRFDRCGDPEQIQVQIRELVASGVLEQAQGEAIDAGKIYAFFRSALGRKLLGARQVLREFKFSILDPGSSYGAGLEGEAILLQGVVDCAIVDSDGITVIDFKTDRVSDENLQALTDRYRLQVAAYRDALERIYKKPVKAAYLYFFHRDLPVPL